MEEEGEMEGEGECWPPLLLLAWQTDYRLTRNGLRKTELKWLPDKYTNHVMLSEGVAK